MFKPSFGGAESAEWGENQADTGLWVKVNNEV